MQQVIMKNVILPKTDYNFVAVKGVEQPISCLDSFQVNGEYSYNKAEFIREIMRYMIIEKGEISVIPSIRHYITPKLPNIYAVLSPFYVLIGIFASVLIADLGIISTSIGFYRFIGNLGLLATIIVATICFANVYKKYK